MSKRCELQKEYYQQYGNYKGVGKYNDDYVKWLENEVLALRIHDVVGRSEQLFCTNCESSDIHENFYTDTYGCNSCGHSWAK